MISQPLPKFQTQFSQKEEVGTYDNIALNERNARNLVNTFGNLHNDVCALPNGEKAMNKICSEDCRKLASTYVFPVIIKQ